MLLVCVPATIATFVEVVGKASSVDTITTSTLNIDACFRADTGYHSCLVFNTDSPIGKRACSSDGIWCFKLVDFDGKQEKVDYQVKFASRLSDVQTSIDSDPICEEPEANVNKCQWEIPNQGFDM
ncbi:2576_t:CDS:1 [Funneliformis geosporum]|uniref:16103_t:CDS:1 n=1 Tax=Funneliformis geosporum TaxID=1117311 RepID=A0A9W4X1J1_9GLOM|nr:16103_t:CDS:1 [Funneliformis geosporum]CAI2188707.1 2576_t:CDS:1 [Funneliformis geosporum]